MTPFAYHGVLADAGVADCSSLHRSGTLIFPTTIADGTPLIGSDAHTIELVTRDIAGVPEPVFIWRP